MLKIHCSGLTLRECKELEALLREQPEIASVHIIPDLSGVQHRAMTYVDSTVPQLWLYVKAAAETPVVKETGEIVGTVLITEATKDIYKVVKAKVSAWLGANSPRGGDGDSRRVTLYDASGHPLDTIRGER